MSLYIRHLCSSSSGFILLLALSLSLSIVSVFLCESWLMLCVYLYRKIHDPYSALPSSIGVACEGLNSVQIPFVGVAVHTHTKAHRTSLWQSVITFCFYSTNVDRSDCVYLYIVSEYESLFLVWTYTHTHKCGKCRSRKHFTPENYNNKKTP